MARSHCKRCTGSIDLIDVDREKIIKSVCPMCLGSVELERRCAGSTWEVADWYQFCTCCGSYWRFEVPERSTRGQVADSVVTLCEGANTIDEKGEPGKYFPEQFERPDHDCWPGTQ